MMSSTVSVSRVKELFDYLMDVYSIALEIESTYHHIDWLLSTRLGGYLAGVVYGKEKLDKNKLDILLEELLSFYEILFDCWKDMFKKIEEMKNRQLISSELANQYLIHLRSRAERVMNTINKYLDELKQLKEKGIHDPNKLYEITDEINKENTKVEKICDKLTDFIPKVLLEYRRSM